MIDEKIKTRKPNFFEMTLLIIGIISIGIGYLFLQKVVWKYGIDSFEASSMLLGWFVLIILIILTAVSENSKEEMKIIIKQQSEELRLLRDDLRRKR